MWIILKSFTLHNNSKRKNDWNWMKSFVFTRVREREWWLVTGKWSDKYKTRYLKLSFLFTIWIWFWIVIYVSHKSFGQFAFEHLSYISAVVDCWLLGVEQLPITIPAFAIHFAVDQKREDRVIQPVLESIEGKNTDQICVETGDGRWMIPHHHNCCNKKKTNIRKFNFRKGFLECEQNRINIYLNGIGDVQRAIE